MEREFPATSSSPTALFFLFAACLLLSLPGPHVVADGHLRLLAPSKPDPSDAAATARWLVAQNSWGVVRHAVSFSDGLPGEGYGIPYFYLTTLDPTAVDALADERASFTVTDIPLGSCGETDPQSPTCAKLTLTGKLKLVDGNSTEGKFALAALFAKHAQMKDWPKKHKFQIFKLDIRHVFLIDWFGGAKTPTVEQYLNPAVNKLS
ncbi:hypothetical protein Taro_043982 [Colocasia esculenta]|uniref:CREG-like beta-barrel domain-containing protein n=1 Tax=Colocasia esculenta TaxID=4460 RepID=A0A843X4U2_COLES|nr:hypothetical protein [Colocasia esculenta]